MSLENRVDSIINEYNLAAEDDGDGHRYRDVKDWKYYSDNYGSPSEMQSTIRRVLHEIAIADLNECLTSPYSFIRDYKLKTTGKSNG